jgi:hypothetical protein
MRLHRFVFPIGALIAVTGCGGGGISNLINNPYKGTYKGEFFEHDSGAIGSVSLNITAAGIISGTATPIVNGKPGAPFKLTGAMASSGSAVISGFEGNTDVGQFASPSSTTMAAYITNESGSSTVWLALLVNPSAPSTGGNPFSGDYAGTVLNTITGITNFNAWTISTSGVVAGSAVIQDSGVPALAAVTGTVSSSGSVAWTVSVGGSVVSTITGNLTLTGTSLTGTLKNSANNNLTLSDTLIE